MKSAANIRRLRTLATSLRSAANGLHDAAHAHDLATGAALNDAKASVPHGQWLSWLVRTGIGQRNAQRLMRMARNG